jgi:hypothetical protein
MALKADCCEHRQAAGTSAAEKIDTAYFRARASSTFAMRSLPCSGNLHKAQGEEVSYSFRNHEAQTEKPVRSVMAITDAATDGTHLSADQHFYQLAEISQCSLPEPRAV